MTWIIADGIMLAAARPALAIWGRLPGLGWRCDLRPRRLRVAVIVTVTRLLPERVIRGEIER